MQIRSVLSLSCNINYSLSNFNKWQWDFYGIYISVFVPIRPLALCNHLVLNGLKSNKMVHLGDFVRVILTVCSVSYGVLKYWYLIPKECVSNSQHWRQTGYDISFKYYA